MYLFAYKSMTTALASNGGRRIEIYKPCALGAGYLSSWELLTKK